MREKRLRRAARNGQYCEKSELLMTVMGPPVNGFCMLGEALSTDVTTSCEKEN